MPQRPSPYAWLPVLVILVAVTAIVIGGLALRYVESGLIAATGDSLATVAGTIAGKLDQALFERYGDIRTAAAVLPPLMHDPSAMTRHLNQLKEEYLIYRWLGVVDRNGHVVAATDPADVGEDRSGAAWFQAVRAQQTAHFEDVTGSYQASGGPVVAFTAPIKGPNGSFLGAVRSHVALSALEDVVRQTVSLYERQRTNGRLEWQFLSLDGSLIADSLLREEGKANLRQLDLPSARLSDSPEPGFVEELHRRRQLPVVTGYARTEGYGDFPGLRWGILVRMDREDILAPIQSVLWKLGLVGAVVWAPMLALLFWAPGRLRREWEQVQQESVRARAAEGALRESEAKIRVIVETALDAVVVMNSGGRITEWNAQAETIFGWSRTEAIGRMLAETVIPPAYREAHERGLRRFLDTGQGPLLSRRIEVTACHRDGREFPVELAITPARQGDRHTFSAFVRDITQRKESEKRQAAQLAVTVALTESRTLGEAAPKLLQAVCETVGWELGVMWRLDRAAALLRCEQVWHVPSEGVEAFAALSRTATFQKGLGLPGRVWATGQSVWIADVLQDANFPRSAGAAQVGLHGAIGFPIILGGELLGVLEFFSRQVRPPDDDVQRMMAEIGIKVGQFIERGLLEEQLRQSQKMDAIGRLAGGIAHDFNNLLTVINGYSQLLVRQMDATDERRNKVEEIKKAGDRAAALTRQLLAFSRKQVLATRVLDLNELVAGMNGMLRRVIGENIDLVTGLGSSLGSIKADSGQIEQVIVNLAVNARDAMPKGGHLTIETANVDVDAALLGQASQVQPGSYVMLAVSDTGCGMDPHTRANMFEPFFTTKEQGKSTGLGLATVYGIIRQSGGHILVASDVGLGTTVKVYLPRVRQAVAAAESVPAADRPVEGVETVLLVEDEGSIRTLLGQELRDRGYHVLEAGDGQEAMELCRRHQGAIHLLLTDVVMPRLGGRELAERLAPLRPDMRVLYMSGYTGDAVVRHGAQESDAAFVQKPFTTSQLLRKVRDLLDGHR